MSKKQSYRCSDCGYSVDVYEGRGFFNQHITMIVCKECRSVHPIVVGGIIGDIAPSFNSECGRLCPHCGSAEIAIWNGNTCPRCGGTMTADGEPDFWC